MIRSTSLSRLRETAYTPPKGKSITLTCRHTALYSGTAVPRPGEWAWCRICNTARKVRKPRKSSTRSGGAVASRPPNQGGRK